MTKNDKIKLGIAVAILIVAAVILYVYFSGGSKPAKNEPLPEGIRAPSRATPPGH